MNRRLLSLLILLTMGAASSCQPAPAPAAPTDVAPANPTAAAPAAATEASPQAEVILTLTGLDGKTQDFTLDDLKKLPSVAGQAGIKSSTGKITPPTLFKGVLLSDLLKQMSATDGAFGIEIEAQDGYAMTFSSDQVAGGDFIAYDPATGDEIAEPGKLQVLIAYEMDGKPLDMQRDGNLRLVVISDKNTQVTDGHWSIKWIRKITAKQMAVDWSLALQGGIDDVVDRGSFESCSTSKCHQSSYKDDQGRAWQGTPLFLFAGRADDAIKHGDGSFNLELFKKGYTVEVIGKDGYSVTFDIANLIGNKDILLANQVDGQPLVEADFPLRLVGKDLTGKQAVGGVEKIILHFGDQPAAATEAPAKSEPPPAPAALPAGKNLMVSGLVTTPLAWSLDELHKMETVKVTVDVPKQGKQEVEGLSLTKLLASAGVKAEAKKISFTAGDGYSASTDLKGILACKDCMLAFGEDNCLKLVLPGLDSGLWVRELVAITLE